jgi:hypothetical protein
LDIVQAAESGGDGNYFWDIRDYEDTHSDSVREFLNLLGIEVKPDGSQIILPLLEAVGRSTTAIHVQARSAYDVLRVFETGIEVPSAHLEAGIVEPLKVPVSPSRRFFTVRSSGKRPENATVQILFRDHWFYIDATDSQSKRAFVFLRTFIGMRLADAGTAQRAPILTVPVN